MSERVHVYPENDLRKHVTDGELCPCLPRVRDGVVTHNAYDAREVGEVVRSALDMLGVQKPPPWSDEERDLYEHAIHLCEMHWPKDDGESNARGTAFPFRPTPKEEDDA